MSDKTYAQVKEITSQSKLSYLVVPNEEMPGNVFPEQNYLVITEVDGNGLGALLDEAIGIENASQEIIFLTIPMSSLERVLLDRGYVSELPNTLVTFPYGKDNFIFTEMYTR